MPPFIDSDNLHSSDVEPKSLANRVARWLCAFVFIIFLISAATGAYFFVLLNKPPANFPVNVPVSIPEGTSAKEATAIFAEAGLVRSELALYFSLVWWYEPSKVKASTYVFSKPFGTKAIAYELTQGNFATDLLRITHKEGERVTAIAATAANILPNFDAEKFIDLAEPLEGTLFPETYFVPLEFTTEELFTLMTKTFTEQISPLQSEINNHPLTLAEIITLASIIEREANSPESMKMVSGILQNRLEIGMALQTDASIEYDLDKPLNELVPKDLEIDSPYNTYLYPGLPPTPIGNPGLEAIKAVLYPTLSDYLFYITGNDGNFYYAKNFDQHRLNIARYLR